MVSSKAITKGRGFYGHQVVPRPICLASCGWSSRTRMMVCQLVANFLYSGL